MCSLDSHEQHYTSFREIQESFSSKYNASGLGSTSHSSSYTRKY